MQGQQSDSRAPSHRLPEEQGVQFGKMAPKDSNSESSTSQAKAKEVDGSDIKYLPAPMNKPTTAVIRHDLEHIHRSQLCNFQVTYFCCLVLFNSVKYIVRPSAQYFFKLEITAITSFLYINKLNSKISKGSFSTKL